MTQKAYAEGLRALYRFTATHQNAAVAKARHGIDADLFWPGLGEIPASELVLRHILPIAQEGLEEWGVSGQAIDRYLGIIEGRCLTGINGADWQVRCVQAFEARGLARPEALTAMTAAYADRMHSNDPVHTWDLP